MEENYVRVQPMREAFLASGMTIAEFARRMGMHRTVPNVDQARRSLGLRPDSDSRVGVRERTREFVTLGMALRMADALGLDPVELDF